MEFDRIDLDVEFSLPLKPNVIIANHVLYHTKNPYAALTRIYGQINSVTRCMVATNGTRSMYSLNRFLPERLREEPMHRLIGGFTLESGFPLVHRVFGSVQTIRYPDGLHITEADPLVSHIASPRCPGISVLQSLTKSVILFSITCMTTDHSILKKTLDFLPM